MSRLSIRNIESLREDAALAAVVRDIARSVMSSTAERAVVSMASEEAPVAGWSVLRDGHGNGVAVHLREVVPSDTALTDIVTRLRSAQAVASLLGGAKLTDVLMEEGDSLSPDWRLFRVHEGRGTVWVAVVGDWRLLSRRGERSQGAHKIRISLMVSLPEDVDVHPGIEVRCARIRLEFPECGVSASFVDVQGDTMKMRVDRESDIETEWSPGIRLDLGELEMTIEDLLALQPGNMLEVEVARPIRTYLRIGHSHLAVGELEVRENGVVVKIVEVL